MPSVASRSPSLASLPCLTRRISIAFSMSPSASVRAFLQSIIPAPVRSRSALTSLAVIVGVLMRWCSSGPGLARGAACAGLLGGGRRPRAARARPLLGGRARRLRLAPTSGSCSAGRLARRLRSSGRRRPPAAQVALRSAAATCASALAAVGRLGAAASLASSAAGLRRGAAARPRPRRRRGLGLALLGLALRPAPRPRAWRAPRPRARSRSSASLRARSSSARKTRVALGDDVADRLGDQRAGADRVVVAGDRRSRSRRGRSWCRPGR